MMTEKKFEKLNGRWITIPKIGKQVNFSRCKKCGEIMYFTRNTGANYKIHNKFHYWSKWCTECRKEQPNPVGPGGGKNIERINELLDTAEKYGRVIYSTKDGCKLIPVPEFLGE